MIELKGQISVIRLYGRLGGDGAIEGNRTVTPGPDVQVVTPSVGYAGIGSVTVDGVTLQEKSVSPTSENQTVLPDAGYYGLSKVNVAAMKDGGYLQDKTISPSTKEQKVSADSGYYGLGYVTVEAAPLQEKEVTPGAAAQEVTPDAGYYGLGKVSVGAATLEPLTVTPTTEEQTFTPESPCIGFSSVTVEAAEKEIEYVEVEVPVEHTSAESGVFGSTTSDYTGRYLYNGVSLPPLIEDKVNTHPYCAVYIQNGAYYKLYMMSNPLKLSAGVLQPCGLVVKFFHYTIEVEDAETATVWDGNGLEYTGPVIPKDLIWTNFDVLDNTTGEVFFKGAPAIREVSPGATFTPVEVEGTYGISGSKLNELADAVRGATGGNPSMSIDEMIAALNAIS